MVFFAPFKDLTQPIEPLNCGTTTHERYNNDEIKMKFPCDADLKKRIFKYAQSYCLGLS